MNILQKLLKRKKGITMMESVVSILIIGIATGGILGAFIVGRYSAERAKHRIAAINAINAKLEDIMSFTFFTYISVVETNFPAQAIILDQRDPGDADDDLTGNMTITITDMDAGLGINGYKKVLVSVTWTERGWGGSRVLSESAITYVVQE